MENVKINGYTNTWSEIDNYEIYHLMENDIYGDETCLLVVDEQLNVICETYDDIITALEDEGII